jgi:hypothetical protein
MWLIKKTLKMGWGEQTWTHMVPRAPATVEIVIARVSAVPESPAMPTFRDGIVLVSGMLARSIAAELRGCKRSILASRRL